MRIGRSTSTHGGSWHPLYGTWSRLARKYGIRCGWAAFVEACPFPPEYLSGAMDCRAGLIDPAKPATLDNVGWILVEKRRE